MEVSTEKTKFIALKVKESMSNKICIDNTEVVSST